MTSSVSSRQLVAEPGRRRRSGCAARAPPSRAGPPSRPCAAARRSARGRRRTPSAPCIHTLLPSLFSFKLNHLLYPPLVRGVHRGRRRGATAPPCPASARRVVGADSRGAVLPRAGCPRRRLVRTNAPPLPRLTCWHSRSVAIAPSTSMCSPFFLLFLHNTCVRAVYARPRGRRRHHRNAPTIARDDHREAEVAEAEPGDREPAPALGAAPASIWRSATCPKIIAEEGAEPHEPGDPAHDRGDREAVRRRRRRDEVGATGTARAGRDRGRRRDVGGERGELVQNLAAYAVWTRCSSSSESSRPSIAAVRSRSTACSRSASEARSSIPQA